MPMSVHKLREIFTQPAEAGVFGRTTTRRLVLGIALYLFIMFILSTDFIVDKVSLEVGQVSDRDVVAPRTVSFINNVKTQKMQREIEASIANVYDLDVSTLVQVESDADKLFDAVRAINGDTAMPLAQKVVKLRSIAGLTLPAGVPEALSRLDEAGVATARDNVHLLVRKYMQHGIKEEDLELARRHIALEAENLNVSADVRTVVAGVAQVLLRPNFTLNEQETEKRRQAALAGVDPVREIIKKGQIIVRRGDVVTPEQIAVMEELGLHKGGTGEIRVFGLSILVVLVLSLMVVYLYRFDRAVYNSDVKLVLLSLIIAVVLVVAKGAHYLSDFVSPIAAGALLATIFINSRVGMLVGAVLALFAAIMADYNLRVMAVVLLGSMAGVYMVSPLTTGYYSLARTGLWVGLTNFAVIGATGLIEQIDGLTLLQQGGLGVVGGIASAVLAIGLLPYLESTFNITTNLKLLDLAKPNHPLLRRLLLEAPGTYHHSLMVGNLAEAAADAIGADPVQVRVGSYYHDVGKIKRPYFFIENQINVDNPHDKIAPTLSTLIVISHIKDGLDLCREYKIPSIITDIVQQHHGTTLVTYFYNRATENEHSECITETDFRYEGPRPQTKEAALVMLADACEASVRALVKPTVNRIEATVRKIIRERLYDGQLDECDLTLKDLNVIGAVFIRVLSGVFHSRLEYPDIKELERRKNRYGSNGKPCANRDGVGSGNGGDDSAGAQ